MVVNQFTVIENHHNKRPDLILFVNGLPLAVIELKNPGDESSLWTGRPPNSNELDPNTAATFSAM